MSVTLPCSRCGATLHPTGRSSRVRCEYCQTDNLIDPATLSQIAAQGPVAPPDQLQRIEAALGPEHKDPEQLIGSLARRLSAALPDQVEIEQGGLFSKHIERVKAQIGDWRYEIARSGKHVSFTRVHQVRGIALKTQELSYAEFTRALAAELYELSLRDMPRVFEQFIAA